MNSHSMRMSTASTAFGNTRGCSKVHRRNYPPANAFDQWVKATDEYFWYSEEAAESAVVTGVGTAWLGLEFARPMEVKCVGLWHNNIPSVPVALQRWDHAQE